MDKVLLFREIISTGPLPVFNDYYTVARIGRKNFYFKAHADRGITIDLLDEAQLILAFKRAKDAKLIDYVNEEKIKELKI